MRLQWFHCAVPLVLSRIATVTYNGSIFPAELPMAFNLIRDLDESCTVVSLVETQKHRPLLNYQETRLFKNAHYDNVPPSVEKLQLIGYVPHNLQAKAQVVLKLHQCPRGSGRVHTFSTTRLIKSHDLELHPLEQSGPSENRVDLTFFSDGCM